MDTNENAHDKLWATVNFVIKDGMSLELDGVFFAYSWTSLEVCPPNLGSMLIQNKFLIHSTILSTFSFSPVNLQNSILSFFFFCILAQFKFCSCRIVA